MSNASNPHDITDVFGPTDMALNEAVLEQGELDALFEGMFATLTPVAPAASVRERLMRTTAGPSRFARFARKVAEMADITRDAARRWLERLEDATVWEGGMLPGIEAVWIEGGPAAACAIRGFVRVEAGHSFPVHRHLGHETSLVLEGEYIGSAGDRYGPGDLIIGEPDGEHGYSAGTAGPLVMFNVVFEGIAIGDMVIRHRDDP